MDEVINKNIKDFSKVTNIIQTALIYIIALLVPTFLGQLIKTVFGPTSVIADKTQFIVGSIVNTCLIVAAINLKGWVNVIGVVTMPSISAILSGFVFKSASPLMAYMIPAIWLGNFALVYSFKLIMLAKGKNYFLAGLVGIVTKVLIIGAGFFLLNAFNVFPPKIAANLKVAMTTIQLITASIGTLIAFVIYALEKRTVKEK